SVIVLDHAAKTFVTRGGEQVVAMSDVSLEVRRNEFVCLVGPSGCGKSTLLRLVAGLVAPTGGTVSIAGTKVIEPREDAGIVFQAPTLLPWASILDNVLFPLDMMGKLDAAGRASFSRWSDFRASKASIRASSPVACSSARASAAHWCTSPTSC